MELAASVLRHKDIRLGVECSYSRWFCKGCLKTALLYPQIATGHPPPRHKVLSLTLPQLPVPLLPTMATTSARLMTAIAPACRLACHTARTVQAAQTRRTPGLLAWAVWKTLAYPILFVWMSKKRTIYLIPWILPASCESLKRFRN